MVRHSTSQIPSLVRGSVITHRRRCGKPTCRCADTSTTPPPTLHESFVLSYSEAGRTRFLMLPPDRVAAVRAATERYRRRRTKLEEEASQGPAELVAQLAPQRRRP